LIQNNKPKTTLSLKGCANNQDNTNAQQTKNPLNKQNAQYE
jgi:hypothetical protein